MMERRRRKTPEQDAMDHIILGRDKSFLQEKFIDSFKGRGVFTLDYIAPSTFVMEYRGTLSQCAGLDAANNPFVFDFIWNGTRHCIDASKEDGTLGRLANDDHINPNCRVKRITVKGRPHLCLFAVKAIFPGEEITYNYGDSCWPWRSMAPCIELSNPEPKQVVPALAEKEMAPCIELSNPEPKQVVPALAEKEMCHHEFTSASISALDCCQDCSGPVSSLKWLGWTCKLCSRSWHKTCYLKNNSALVKDVEPFSDEGSICDKDYVPDSSPSREDSSSDFAIQDAYSSCSDSDVSLSINPKPPHCKTAPTLSMETTKSVPPLRNYVEPEAASNSDKVSVDEDLIPDSASYSDHEPTTSSTQRLGRREVTGTESSCSEEGDRNETELSSEVSSCTHKNYCFVCKKPQSKIARHLKNHEKEEPDIARAFLLPKHSKERKKLLEVLRNKGNYEHNRDVMGNQRGALKLKRRPGKSNSSVNAKTYVHCVYCKGLFVRKELWRHLRRCPSKKHTEDTGTAQVLALADVADSTFSQAISPGVWKILGNMKQDEVASVVRNDFLILQLGQSLYNKHGSDSTKFEYIRQKVREMGRLLLSLRKKCSIFSFEDAVKPNNFYKVIEAVKDVAGYDEEKHSYRTPSLALKLGHSLKKIGDIILCRAIAAEDEEMMKVSERFTKLCSKEWSELVSHNALSTLSKAKFNKPSTIPFTQDVQLLHQHLEKKSADAVEDLKKHESPQTYTELARVTLAQIIVFNRRRAGEVSKMTLESFKKRDQTELHEDIAVGLSPFEQKLAKHFSRVEMLGKRGRKVAVLLNPEVVSATTLLADKRDSCNVHRDNPFLFGKPRCPPSSYYRGQDCIRGFASRCGAKNPEYLKSTHLRKHVATLSQILNLKNNELDQLANFLGHDIRVHRDFYRLPEATIEMAKISKLLLAMEKGSLGRFQGKSLDEIEIEDELDPETIGEEDPDDDDDDGDDDGDGEKSHPVLGLRGKRKTMTSSQDETKNSKGKRSHLETRGEVTSSKEVRRRYIKKSWSKMEVSAVMKHFKAHILKGHLATKMECEQCKLAEDHILKGRTVQNIRDFVRNRGRMSTKGNLV
ncbi:uncharacterized protein LOC134132279 isoform X3 [Pungitius pungitius]|uniref:uncharacterized protein si:dkey-38n4.2 isoform X3 n=1 Tax=Pungitius pungitius TaxID=134920 RepID=UPI002E163215